MQPLVDGRSRGLFWSRPMCAAEWALLAQYFGELSDPRWHRMRVHLRRLGDTRRALSFNGGFLSFPRYCFEGGDPRQPLRLDQPMICGWLMHEAFHHWQRLQGRAVTRDALRLQWRFWRHGDDPYQYALCESPEALLTRFQQAQVEQQAKQQADQRWLGVDPGDRETESTRAPTSAPATYDADGLDTVVGAGEPPSTGAMVQPTRRPGRGLYGREESSRLLPP